MNLNRFGAIFVSRPRLLQEILASLFGQRSIRQNSGDVSMSDDDRRTGFDRRGLDRRLELPHNDLKRS